MERLKPIFNLIQSSIKGWSKDNASMLAAGLAYYTTFAIAPLLVIAVAVAGFIFSDAAVEGRIVETIQGSVGREAAVVIENLIIQTQNSGAGPAATIISAVVLFFGASGLFINLQKALNQIWGLAPPADAGITRVLKQRLLAITMVLGVGLLVLLSFLLNAGIAYLDELLTEWFPIIGGALPELGFVVSLLLLTLAFALIFKFLPSAHLAWRDVFLGAFVTALLFSFGRFLISLYLRRGGVSSTYGAAGSLAVILLFVYYSMQIILLGAEFTQVYADRFGSRLRPDEDARIIIRQEAPATQKTPAAPLLPRYPAPMVLEAQRQWERQVAAGLIGLALGLALAFLSARRR